MRKKIPSCSNSALVEGRTNRLSLFSNLSAITLTKPLTIVSKLTFKKQHFDIGHPVAAVFQRRPPLLRGEASSLDVMGQNLMKEVIYFILFFYVLPKNRQVLMCSKKKYGLHFAHF